MLGIVRRMVKSAMSTPIGPNEPFPEIARLPSRIRLLSFPYSVDDTPGWLQRDEAKTLYALGFWIDGPILEIGAWAGKSTSCIAWGIRDSGRAKTFITSELNPTTANFPVEGESVHFVVPAGSSQILATIDRLTYERDILPVLSEPGGVIGALRRTLTARGIDGRVQIVEGHFRNVPIQTFRMVFTDTMHTPVEVRENAAQLRPLLGVGSILACHDSNAENEATLRECLPIGESCTIDSLFVGRVTG